MLCLVSLTGTGLFIFRFGCLEDMSRILDTYPHSIAKKKLLLARWTHGMINVELLQKATVWVCMTNIPFHLWSSNILLAMASAIGKSLMFDEITASQSLQSYARILVEVDLSKDLPPSVWMDIEGESSTNIPVIYVNLPCSSCLKLGHRASTCPQVTGKRPLFPDS